MGQRHRSARSGQFVSAEVAAASPDTTVAEAIEQVIPRYAMLDVWVALGHEPSEFDAWYEQVGHAKAWAALMAAVRV